MIFEDWSCQRLDENLHTGTVHGNTLLEDSTPRSSSEGHNKDFNVRELSVDRDPTWLVPDAVDIAMLFVSTQSRSIELSRTNADCVEQPN